LPSRNFLLRSFGPALEQIRPKLSSIPLRAGQVIYEPGDRVERIYFPVSGLISARALLESGHQMECSLVGRTNALGAVAAVGFHSALTRDACIVDGQAWVLSLNDLHAAMRSIPRVEAQMRLFSYTQMAYAVRVGVCNALHTAEQRIARWLLIASDLLGAPEIRLAQEELSNILGLQRSAVSPSLQRLKAEGLIELSRGRVAVANARALERRACECHRALRDVIAVDPSDAGAPREVLAAAPAS
jgi:CRP-like cAMP-binding protein